MDVFKLTGSAMEDRGNFFATMYIALAGGCLVSYFSLGMTANTVAQHMSHKFRRQGFEDMLRQDLQFFDRPENNVGALTGKLDANPQSILELMGHNIGLVIICVVNVLACSILSIVHSWKLGLVVVLAGLPPLLTAGWLKIRTDVKLDTEVSKRNATSASIASEAILAIRTISSLAVEEHVLDRYLDQLTHAVNDSTKPLTIMMVWFALTQCMEFWFLSLGFWYGCRLLGNGEVTMYNFYVAFMSVFFSGQATSQLFQFSTSMTKGKTSANYLFWLHNLQATVRETPENKDNAPKSGGPIALDHVRFSYPLRPDVPVLRGVDLEVRIHRGQRSENNADTVTDQKGPVRSLCRRLWLW